MLGTIGPVERARVSELRNFDNDRCLSSTHRAMQRGVKATGRIVEQVADGVLADAADSGGNKLVVIDMLCNRFSEWGHAVWDKQKAVLQGPAGKDLYFMSFLTQAEHDEWKDPVLFRLPGLVTGQIVEEWWDSCPAAGPKTRQRQAFAESRPTLEVLSVQNNALMIPTVLMDSFDFSRQELKAMHQQMETKIKSWNEKWCHVLRGEGTSRAGDRRAPTSPASPNVSRVLCRPEFAETETPLDPTHVHNFTDDGIAPFEQLTELLASGPAVGNSKVKVQITQGMELYLTNETSEDLAVGPIELFGFGLGSFSEQLTRDAKHNNQAVHFLLRTDGDLVVYQGDDQRDKKVFNLAGLICHIGEQHGVMEINLQTYNLEPMMKEDGTAQNFRYQVLPKTLATIFSPKKIEQSVDKMNMRATMLGGE